MSVFETTKEVLTHLSAKNGKPVMMLSGAESKLKNICDIFDDMIEEFDAETYTVTVEPGTLSLEIRLVVPEMIVEDCTEHGLFKLIEMVDSFGFSVDDGNICLNTTTKDLFYIAM